MAGAVGDVHDDGMDNEGLTHLLTWIQDGVVSRRQLLELGASPNDVRRMVRRRDLTPVHLGVYVTHTGPLTWRQRAWAAVLVHWPAALAHGSALPNPAARGPVHVAIDVRRSVAPVAGVIVHRTAGLAERIALGSSPPRIALEHAVLDVAVGRTDVVGRFRALADAVQTRRTTASAICAVARTRRGLTHRAEIIDLLTDLHAGACSVLEREYLLLERRHGLRSTATTRQATAQVRGGRIFRDVDYDGLALVVELDGRAFHDNAASRDSDALRDLESAVHGDRLTIRLTYALVVRDGCHTMGAVAELMTRRGWTGRLTPCPDCR